MASVPRRAFVVALALGATALALLVGLAAIGSAQPTCTSTWTGAADDGLWSTAGNWSGGVPNSSTSVACIETSGASVTLTGRYAISALVLGTGRSGTSTLTIQASGSNAQLSLSSASTIHARGPSPMRSS